MEIHQRMVPTSGFTTFFHECGAAAAPPILLLHGSGPGANAMSNWQFALPFLGKSYRCLAPDIAGFGQSPHHTPPLGAAAWIDVWVTQMIDFLDALSWGVFPRLRPTAVPSRAAVQASTKASAERTTVSTAWVEGSLR